MRIFIAVVGLLLVVMLVLAASNSGNYRALRMDSLQDTTAEPFPWAIATLLVVGSLAALRLPTVAMAAFLLAGMWSLYSGVQTSSIMALVLAGLSFLTSRQKAKA